MNAKTSLSSLTALVIALAVLLAACTPGAVSIPLPTQPQAEAQPTAAMPPHPCVQLAANSRYPVAIHSDELGYCYAVPAGFEPVQSEDGTPYAIGAPLDNSVEPVRVSVSVISQPAAPDANLEEDGGLLLHPEGKDRPRTSHLEGQSDNKIPQRAK